MNAPISFMVTIVSWKSGTGKFSGSFLSIHYFHGTSFLVILSGNSRKKASPSLPGPKLCLERAKIFNHTLSYKKERGFALSFLISNAAPDFKNRDTSEPVIFIAVYKILKHIIKIKVILSFSNNPRFTYL